MATIAARAHTVGLTIDQALSDYPLSMILQIFHAQSTMNGGEYDWTNVPELEAEDVEYLDLLFDREPNDIF